MKRIIVAALVAASIITLLAGVWALPWHGLTLWERWREGRTGRIYYAGATRARVVALTFDDGPDPRYTPRVLDVLRSHRVHATFFVVGRMLEAHPDLGARIAAEGHVIGNHTETHPHLERERDPQARRELQDCERAIERSTGERTYLFRPPRGYWNTAVYRDAVLEGYRIVLWSLAFDHRALRSPDALRRRVVRLARPGDILLLHDGSSMRGDERGVMVRDLPAIIEGLRRRGFRFVTVPELLHIAGDAPSPRVGDRAPVNPPGGTRGT